MGRAAVLVIEDEPRLRFIVERQLKEAGFDVVAEESGEAAMKTLETLTPDLVLVNILLTGIGGIEVCERIRANRKLANVPVIFFTAKTDDESRARCMAAGANDYITKPWNRDDLLLRVRNAIAANGSGNGSRP